MSARKNNLVTYTTIDGGDMSGNLTSVATDIRWLDNMVLYLAWTGTPTGTFKVQVSPDNSTWFDLNVIPPPAASGLAGNHRVSLHQLPDPYVRVTYVAASGSGTLTSKIAGKML